MVATRIIGGTSFNVRSVVGYPPPQGGWTDPLPSGDTQVAYCSDSIGSDSYDGFRATSDGSGHGPKKTINAAKALLRAGFPDWLLLYRGDTFTNQRLGNWTTNNTAGGTPLSGRGSLERMVVGAYGTGARPIINFQVTQHGFVHDQSTPMPAHIYVLGIDFQCPSYAGSGQPSGARLDGACAFIHFEDCRFGNALYPIGVGVLGTQAKTAITFRRCQGVDAFGSSSAVPCGGTFAYVNGLLIEDCLFDNCGNFSPWGIGAWIHSTCTNVTGHNNTATKCGINGFLYGGGGTVQNALVASCPTGITMGYNGSDSVAGGVGASCSGALITEPRTNSVGIGIEFQNITSGDITNCLLTNGIATSLGGIYLNASLGDSGGGSGKVRDVTISATKIYKWLTATGGLRVDGQNFTAQPQSIANILFKTSDVQEPTLTAGYLAGLGHDSITGEILGGANGNRYHRGNPTTNWFGCVNLSDMSTAQWKTLIGDTSSSSSQVSYADATLTLGGYHGSLGGTATTQGFIDSFRSRHRNGSGGTLWSDSYLPSAVKTYFDAGFAG